MGGKPDALQELDPDSLQHSVQIFEHFIIPEAQDAITTEFKPTSSLAILLRLICMLSSIDLDDELR